MDQKAIGNFQGGGGGTKAGGRQDRTLIIRRGGTTRCHARANGRGKKGWCGRGAEGGKREVTSGEKKNTASSTKTEGRCHRLEERKRQNRGTTYPWPSPGEGNVRAEPRSRDFLERQGPAIKVQVKPEKKGGKERRQATLSIEPWLKQEGREERKKNKEGRDIARKCEGGRKHNPGKKSGKKGSSRTAPVFFCSAKNCNEVLETKGAWTRNCFLSRRKNRNSIQNVMAPAVKRCRIAVTGGGSTIIRTNGGKKKSWGKKTSGRRLPRGRGNPQPLSARRK